MRFRIDQEPDKNRSLRSINELSGFKNPEVTNIYSRIFY
jgi:hypothetical protein